jgi:hypothetical protein
VLSEAGFLAKVMRNLCGAWQAKPQLNRLSSSLWACLKPFPRGCLDLTWFVHTL